MLRIVALADLHVGSGVGLSIPDETPRGDSGRPVRDLLYKFYRRSVRGPWAQPDVLIVNGDIIDGQNRKQSGFGTWTSNLQEQADQAVELLRMWKAQLIYIVRGSPYHIEANNSGLYAEEYIARQLGAEEYPNQSHKPVARRDHSGWHWYVHAGGVTFHVSHKIGVSRVFHYQSTPTARAMLHAKLNDQLRHLDPKYKTQIVLRAHAHYFNMVGYSGSKGFVLPCWKGLDDFMQSNDAVSISPDIGFVGFEVKNNGDYSYEAKLTAITDIQPGPLSVVRR